MTDAVVIGSGPNGLVASIELARRGLSVVVLEARETIGGGMRTAELTLPGFLHDVCSACHPMGVVSPAMRRYPLEEHGLEWIRPPVSAAHPLDGEPAALLRRSVEETGHEVEDGSGHDARAYRRFFAPYVRRPHDLLEDLMGPLRIPSHPIRMARFGLPALLPARTLSRLLFRGHRAQALLAGCAAHSILPLERMLTGAVGMIFALTAHVDDWPVAAGGSQAIADSLASYLRELGGRIETGVNVRSVADIPPSRVVLFDTSPDQLAAIGADTFPPSYLRRLARFRYGPGVFKVDYALSAPIPWKDPRCLEASTVHVGGTLEEVAAAEAASWEGRHAERPFVMVVQQSQFDAARAPAGKHTGYAYCHVPSGSTMDCTEAIEAQLERFAPGFRDVVLARHRTNTVDLAAGNANCVGGAIAGGAADLSQFFTRPVARLDPYTTPNPAWFLCSASTPPGGGVHGMCGFFAARSAMRRLGVGASS